MTSEYNYKNRKPGKGNDKNKQMKIALVAIICFIVLTIAVVIAAFYKKSVDKKKLLAGTDNELSAEETVDESGKIAEGIHIDTVSVGGMDFDAAYEAIETYVKPSYEKELNVNIGGNAVSMPLADLDFSCDVKKSVDDAFVLTESKSADKDVNVEFTLNEAKLETFLTEECSKYTKKAKNATMKRRNGEFVISKSKKGTSINIEGTKNNIYDQIGSGFSKSGDINVDAALDIITPEYSSKELSKCTSILGKFSTSFSEGQVQRSANIRNAVSFIDGSIVYPDEKFSVAGTIFPLSADNGYSLAPSYQGGQVIDSLGGGVCQVSTTLYNAALLSELKIVDRSCHSMMVSYVKPSMDAAIAGDYKDMKFINNTGSPLYIQGNATGGILTFTIYGKETRPSNRKIQYVSVVTSTISPGADVITKDPSQPESYEKVTQSAHVGYVADLYKIVYVDGVEQSREQVNHSRYKAEPRHIIVGTKKGDDKDKKTSKQSSSKSGNSKSSNSSNKSNNTGNSENNSSDNQSVSTEETHTQEQPQETPTEETQQSEEAH